MKAMMPKATQMRQPTSDTAGRHNPACATVPTEPFTPLPSHRAAADAADQTSGKIACSGSV